MEAFHAHLKNVPHCCIQIILFFIRLIQWLCPPQVHWRRTVLLTRGPCWGFARAQAPQGESTNRINADSINNALNVLKWLLSIAWLRASLLFSLLNRRRNAYSSHPCDSVLISIGRKKLTKGYEQKLDVIIPHQTEMHTCGVTLWSLFPGYLNLWFPTWKSFKNVVWCAGIRKC